MAIVRIESGITKGAEYIILGNSVTIGRKLTNGIIIGDSKSSREHTLIKKEGDHFLVKDLGSRNGTFLNGERVAQSEIHSGDRIRIGNTVMTFVDSNATGSHDSPVDDMGEVVELEEVTDDAGNNDIVSLDDLD